MVEVYYYIPAEEAENAVDCGLKLSRWFDKEIQIQGETKKCISTLLNPKDDPDKYRSQEYQCLKLELDTRYCFAADRYLYDIGLAYPVVMNMYSGSVIPIQNYIFGSYRLPECLVTSTVITGQVSLLNKRKDSPILFNNSEDLYINNVIEGYKEVHDDFHDVMLYYFYCKLAQIGKADKIEDSEKKIAVFFDKAKEKAYTIKIPDLSVF